MSQNEYEERKPIIYLAGIGMGQDDQLTGEVLDCLDPGRCCNGSQKDVRCSCTLYRRKSSAGSL